MIQRKLYKNIIYKKPSEVSIMQNEIVEIMLTEEQIQNRIKEMAAEINKEIGRAHV